MDKKAIYNLSYGVFMLSTRSGEKVNGCITNTCMQVAGNPVRVAISVLNTNYTCDLLKESGIFALSILDQTCSFATIKHFGFQSGRDVDKFADLQMPNGMECLCRDQRKSSRTARPWHTYVIYRRSRRCQADQ